MRRKTWWAKLSRRAGGGGAIVQLVVHPAFGLDVRVRRHGLVHQVVGKLGMHFQHQLAQNHVAELAVGDDVLEVFAAGPEVGEQVGSLLVTVDRVSQAPFVPLPAGHDLGMMLGQDVVDMLDGVVPGRGRFACYPAETFASYVFADKRKSLLRG